MIKQQLLTEPSIGEDKDLAVEVMDNMTSSLLLIIRMFLQTAGLRVTKACALEICIKTLQMELDCELDVKQVSK
tara:strand:- start:6250 stop:6471 length:222 start_codon:yes stop_codon:yes gene_type:complete